MTGKKVAILGGGIAGLSAAQELIERGFSVDIYESRPIPGGKARSFDYRPADADKHWRRGLPAEHGFRFFPGFYRHIIDSMQRIDDFAPGSKVIDNLVAADEIGLAAYEHELIRLPAGIVPTPGGVLDFLKQYKQALAPLLNEGDIACYAEKIWQILTSCQQRRIAEYEKIGWQEFIDANNPERSEHYYKYFGKLARSLVAADPEQGSAKTIGDITVQLYLDMSRQGIHFDRVLNGPTNEMFIHPWLHDLINKGCNYYLNTSVSKIKCENSRISGVTIHEETRWQQRIQCPLQCDDACKSIEHCRKQAIRVLACDREQVTEYEPVFPVDAEHRSLEIEADYFIAAMPVEVMAKLLNEDLLAADSSLKNIKTLANNTAWMNGLLFYLDKDVEVCKGHTVYVDPPWALTSISQIQFWKNNVDIRDYGQGDVGGILSLDISDWDNPENPAYYLSRDEVIAQGWAYVKRCLNHKEQHISDYLYACLDPSIEEFLQLQQLLVEQKNKFKGSQSDEDKQKIKSILSQQQQKLENLEPLLINKVNTWALRPNAHTRIDNFFLASDYVRTNTDLASMEAANEAARRAVNCILDQAGVKRGKCKIWQTQEPWILAPYRWLDKRCFNQGLPWQKQMPWFIRLLVIIWQHLHVTGRRLSTMYRQGKTVLTQLRKK